MNKKAWASVRGLCDKGGESGKSSGCKSNWSGIERL
jgi:hypothetical protein